MTKYVQMQRLLSALLLENIDQQAKREKFDQSGDDPIIPRVSMLSGRGGDVIDRVSKWLQKRYPLPAGRTFLIHQIREDPNYERVRSRDFTQLMQRWNVPLGDQATYTTAAGLHNPAMREIAILFDTLNDIHSSNVYQRMLGIRVICHEYWHLLRQGKALHRQFEEGGAELFADQAVLEMTGYVCQEAEQSRLYRQYALGVRNLNEFMSGNPEGRWYLRSREAPDQITWLYNELQGRTLMQNAQRIAYPINDAEWYKATFEALEGGVSNDDDDAGTRPTEPGSAV